MLQKSVLPDTGVQQELLKQNSTLVMRVTSRRGQVLPVKMSVPSVLKEGEGLSRDLLSFFSPKLTDFC